MAKVKLLGRPKIPQGYDWKISQHFHLDSFDPKKLSLHIESDQIEGRIHGVELYKKIMDQYPEIHLIASGGIKDMEDIKKLGKINPYAVVVGKAINEKKVIVEGIVDPKHIMTDIDNAGENFTRALRIQVPDDKGNLREILVGQLPGTTSLNDINENILYTTATEIPGSWSQIAPGTQVLQPASPLQREALWEKYKDQEGVS